MTPGAWIIFCMANIACSVAAWWSWVFRNNMQPIEWRVKDTEKGYSGSWLTFQGECGTPTENPSFLSHAVLKVHRNGPTQLTGMHTHIMCVIQSMWKWLSRFLWQRVTVQTGEALSRVWSTLSKSCWWNSLSTSVSTPVSSCYCCFIYSILSTQHFYFYFH